MHGSRQLWGADDRTYVELNVAEKLQGDFEAQRFSSSRGPASTRMKPVPGSISEMGGRRRQDCHPAECFGWWPMPQGLPYPPDSDTD